MKQVAKESLAPGVELQADAERGRARRPDPGGGELRGRTAADVRSRAVSSCSSSRSRVQARLESGTRLDFLPETADVRAGDWSVAPVPEELLQRTVEITGPAEPKMIINALNSGADVFMADFEDSLSPTWEAVIGGQHALRAAVRRELSLGGAGGRQALHLGDDARGPLRAAARLAPPEAHLPVDGEPVSASLFDFGLFFFHNAREQLARGTGTLLLPAQAGEPPRGAAVERRVPPRAAGAGDPPGHHQGHGAHRLRQYRTGF